MADTGGGSGGGSGGSGGATGGSSGTSTGTSAFNANVESVANSQLINEVSTIGGGNQATKMVGWNAVPSGFEPLQRSIGQRKLAYQFSNFSGGLNKKTSARDISLSECTSATNICFGNQGKITVLGDAKLETGSTSMANNSANATGYGAFVFNSAYSLASTPVKGNYEIIARGGMTAGNNIVFSDGAATQTLDFGDVLGNDHLTDVAPSIYAQGNGVYACDANFLDIENEPKALILVDRPDINNGTVPITKWVIGKPLLNSPTIGTATNNINDQIITSGSEAFATGDGEATLHIEDDIGGSTTGGWGLVDTSETFTFYASWLFDGINETALSTMSNTLACIGTTIGLNISIQHTAALPVGGDARINGMRVYYSKASENNAKKFFLAEASWEEGVRKEIGGVWTPWDTEATSLYNLASNMIIDNPPDLLEYVDLNGYFEDEVYDTAGNTSAITPFPIKYKTSTIGADGKVYIANVAFNAQLAVGDDVATKIPISQDTMMFSLSGRPGCFPKLNTYESPSVEGGAITALESFSDKILQFRENSVAVVNVSRPQFYVENVFNNIGVANPCQVCRVPFGIAWANSEGCYLYDGEGVTSLTHGKFTETDWGLIDGSVVAGYELDRGSTPTTNKASDTNGDAVLTPSIGYDPRSKRLVIFKNIENDDDGTVGGDDAFIYDFMTQSWSEAQDIIAKTAAQAISNFVIYKGNLSFWWEGDAVIQNYSATPSGNQTIEYITKDIDFGAPSVRKKIYKIIVNYVPGGSSTDIDVTYAVDGSGSFSAMSANLDADTSIIERAEIKPSATVNNIYSLQLKFDGTAEETFEIEDITIIYRMKKVK